MKWTEWNEIDLFFFFRAVVGWCIRFSVYIYVGCRAPSWSVACWRAWCKQATQRTNDCECNGIDGWDSGMRQTNGNSMNALDRDFAMNNRQRDLVVQMMHACHRFAFRPRFHLERDCIVCRPEQEDREQREARLASLEIISMEFLFSPRPLLCDERSCLMCEKLSLKTNKEARTSCARLRYSNYILCIRRGWMNEPGSQHNKPVQIDAVAVAVVPAVKSPLDPAQAHNEIAQPRWMKWMARRHSACASAVPAAAAKRRKCIKESAQRSTLAQHRSTLGAQSGKVKLLI